MNFDPGIYGAEVSRLLAIDGHGQRLMPLAFGRCPSEDARRILQTTSAAHLLPSSAAPDAALAGLWLYFSCNDEAHQVSQDIATPEGSFWHGIVHRQEPDPHNSAYWFRRVGSHPIFPQLRDEAERIVQETGASFSIEKVWDPMRFIEFCGDARTRPGSIEERAAMLIQREEWQWLFDYCARPRP